jgi:hypothetical protein
MTMRPFIGALARGISKRPPPVAARLVAATSLWMIFGAAVLASADPARPSISSPSEAPFLRENEAAMRKMMVGTVIPPSGDVDRDFADMMAPHHQGAIDMAIAVLRHGHNEQIRRLAQETVIKQQQEIVPCAWRSGRPLRLPSQRPRRHRARDKQCLTWIWV